MMKESVHLLVFSIVSLGFSLSSLSYAMERESWAEWQTAKNLYDSRKFDDALQEFQENPKDNSVFYYNMGTTYFRLGKLGQAVAYLEKANYVQPHDPDTQYNLSIAKTALSQTIGPDKLDPASSWVEQIADRVSLDEVRATLGLLGIIVALLWIRAYLKTRSLQKVLFQPSSLIGILCFGITAGIYGIQRWADSTPPAVSLTKQAIRSGPGEHYVELSLVDAGSKLRILGPSAASSAPPSLGSENTASSFKSEIWRQVRFSEDGIGWIKAANLLTL